MNITYGNILAVFFLANEAEIEEGRTWYARANTIARNIGQKYAIKWERIAGVIAALSPNNRWNRNIIDAEAMARAFHFGEPLDAVKVSTFNGNKNKAIAILNGEDPEDVLGGNKVRAFYHCIIEREDVCIDGHAYAIWIGERVPTTKTPHISDKLYHNIAYDYKRAAIVINQISGEQFLPSEIQAITWVVWRNRIQEGINE